MTLRTVKLWTPHAPYPGADPWREASRVGLRVLLSGPDPTIDTSAVLVVFVHGFPELALSWKRQLEALGKAGYACAAPDMRGYGGSSVFRWGKGKVCAYEFENVTKDLVFIVHAMKRTRAVFIGHDFGGAMVWAMAQHHPEVCLGVVGINTPLMCPNDELLAVLRENGGPMATLMKMSPEACGHLDYQAYFQTHGEEELSANAERTLCGYFRSQLSNDPEENKRNMSLGVRMNKVRTLGKKDGKPRGILHRAPAQIPRDPLWSQSDLDVYVQSFKRTGFPLGYYRAMDSNFQWDLREGVYSRKITGFPCLMITASRDAVLRPEDSLAMDARIPNLARASLECGHWTPIERSNELNSILLEFLARNNNNNRHHRL